jgi:hypothetical protein
MPHWKVDVELLYLAVEAVQRYRRMTARGVAAEVGVPPSTLTRMKEGSGVDMNAFVSFVSWLGADPMRFVVRSQGAPAERGDEGSKILVDREDVLIAYSWAREALAELPAPQLPAGEARIAVQEALERLQEEAGAMSSLSLAADQMALTDGAEAAGA